MTGGIRSQFKSPNPHTPHQGADTPAANSDTGPDKLVTEYTCPMVLPIVKL